MQTEARFFFETYRRPGLWIWRFQDVLSLEFCFFFNGNVMVINTDDKTHVFCEAIPVMSDGTLMFQFWCLFLFLLQIGRTFGCWSVATQYVNTLWTRGFSQIFAWWKSYPIKIHFFCERWLVRWPDSHKSKRFHKKSQVLMTQGSRITQPPRDRNNQGLANHLRSDPSGGTYLEIWSFGWSFDKWLVLVFAN